MLDHDKGIYKKYHDKKTTQAFIEFVKKYPKNIFVKEAEKRCYDIVALMPGKTSLRDYMFELVKLSKEIPNSVQYFSSAEKNYYPQFTF